MKKPIVMMFLAQIVMVQSSLFAQEADATGLFVSVHGCAFRSTSGTHGGFYGNKAHGAFGVGVGSQRSQNVTTFAYVTYHPPVKGILSSSVKIGFAPFQYEVKTQREIHMWLLNLGVEFRLLSTGPLSIAATVGGVAGLSTDEGPNRSGEIQSKTTGVIGVLVGPAANLPIAGTPLTISLIAHYRYAPPLSSIQHNDNSGVPVVLGLRYAI